MTNERKTTDGEPHGDAFRHDPPIRDDADVDKRLPWNTGDRHFHFHVGNESHD